MSWTPGCDKMKNAARRDSPLGPVCCAQGGCVPQEADVALISAMATKHVLSVIPEDLTGNCVLDFETWQPVIDYDNKFFGYCPNFLPTSDGDWRPHGGATWPPKHLIVGETLIFNYSVALVKRSQPHLSEADAEAEAARQFLTAGVGLYVAVLEAAREARPKCHWGFWGNAGLCSYHRLCTNQTASSGDPLCGFLNPAYRQKVWNLTQQQLPIVAASDALFPEIYIESPYRDSGYSTATTGYRRGEMRSVVSQAVAAGVAVGGKPVLPFMRTACFLGRLACYSKPPYGNGESSTACKVPPMHHAAGRCPISRSCSIHAYM